MYQNWPAKQPDEELDYKIDWRRALGTDNITASAWELVSGTVTISSSSFNSKTTLVWLSGGEPGTSRLKNTITTENGRTFVATVNLPVRS